jgi:dUTP pyrophosphatase
MKVVLDPGAKMPTRAHELDAGLDLYSPVDVLLYNDDSVTIDTGVHVAIPEGYVGMIKSKSGLNVKHSLTSEGVIDAGYTGSIVVKLYNHGRCAFSIQKGQKISQLVILPIITPDLELVDSLECTDRGNGGFGSTGKF